ncbi:MAG: hypothetical protein ACTSVO_06260 [Candidatus Heimdallarchaeaceae archaeon]
MSKKYRVSNIRGIPWVLLAVLSLAIYLWFTFDTGEYNVYIIVITAAVVLIWFARFFRKRHVSKQFDNYSDKLSVHFDERTAREDFGKGPKTFDESGGNLCEYCGTFQSSSSSIKCEHCGKELS